MTDVPVEYSVDEKIATFALRMDEVDAPTLLQEFEAFLEIYQYIRDTKDEVSKSDIKQMLSYREIEPSQSAGELVYNLEEMGLIRDVAEDGRGWYTTEE